MPDAVFKEPNTKNTMAKYLQNAIGKANKKASQGQSEATVEPTKPLVEAPPVEVEVEFEQPPSADVLESVGEED